MRLPAPHGESDSSGKIASSLKDHSGWAWVAEDVSVDEGKGTDFQAARSEW